MPRYKNLNGVRVQLTAEEEATRDTEEKIWSDAKSTRQLAEIRRIRNEKLSETDYLAMSDNIMSENMIDFRKQLRDIPQDYSEADYDNLLARDEQGNLTHTVWEKP
jgi:RNA-splicing ligase RtcB